MLRSMQLENFKAFGQRTVIPLAPITLIFGQNSSGKSSILQSLSLLKQTRDSRDVEALLLPRTDGGIVDLGSFQEMLFDHDMERLLSIRLDAAWDKLARRDVGPRYLPNAGSVALEIAFQRKTLKQEISLSHLNVFHQGDGTPLVRFEPTEIKRGVRFYNAYLPFSSRAIRRYSPGRFRAAKAVKITNEERHWQRSYDGFKKVQTQYIKALEGFLVQLESGSGSGPFPPNYLDDDDNEEGKRQLVNKLKETLTFFSSDFDIKAFITHMSKEECETLISLDGFLPSQEMGVEQAPSVPELLSRFGEFRTGVSLDVGRFAALAGAAVRQILTMLFPIGPFRKPAERYYIFTGATPQDVGYQGHQLPDLLFRHPELVRDTNSWLEKLDIGYSLQIKPLGRSETDLYEVRLSDTRRNPPVEVGLTDVGFGISQILPLVVQSLAGSSQIISVEQPEVHIHPRLQADLGDLLIEAIKEPRLNQFIIETHSEHLALRLQRRVREKKLAPSEISIVYVSRGPTGAVIQPLRLDDEGDFMDDFPGGFFPERLRELR